MKPLKKGDRIRLKVRTIFGWKGTATVVEDQRFDDTVRFVKDGDSPDDFLATLCYACRHEVSKIRQKATP